MRSVFKNADELARHYGTGKMDALVGYHRAFTCSDGQVVYLTDEHYELASGFAYRQQKAKTAEPPVNATEVQNLAKTLAALPTLTDQKSPSPSAHGIGAKFDGDKVRFELLWQGCPRVLEGVAAVLTFGAKKYAAHSWQKVPDAINRYTAAMLRHMNAIAKGETHDPESGLPHVDHIACNALFLGELHRLAQDRGEHGAATA